MHFHCVCYLLFVSWHPLLQEFGLRVPTAKGQDLKVPENPWKSYEISRFFEIKICFHHGLQEFIGRYKSSQLLSSYITVHRMYHHFMAHGHWGPTMHVNFPPEVDAQRFRGHAVLISAAEQSRHRVVEKWRDQWNSEDDYHLLHDF